MHTGMLTTIVLRSALKSIFIKLHPVGDICLCAAVQIPDAHIFEYVVVANQYAGYGLCSIVPFVLFLHAQWTLRIRGFIGNEKGSASRCLVLFCCVGSGGDDGCCAEVLLATTSLIQWHEQDCGWYNSVLLEDKQLLHKTGK